MVVSSQTYRFIQSRSRRKMAETFTFFSKLPPEIRLMIWREAMPDPRVFEVLDSPGAKQKTAAHIGLMFANPRDEPPPSLVAVCHESKDFVLRHYQPLTLSGTTKYLDLAKDVLLLEPYLLVKRLLRTLQFLQQIPQVRDKISRLALGTSYGVCIGICHPILSCKVSKNNIVKLLEKLARFPRLESLVFIVHHDFRFEFDFRQPPCLEGNQPYSFFPHHHNFTRSKGELPYLDHESIHHHSASGIISNRSPCKTTQCPHHELTRSSVLAPPHIPEMPLKTPQVTRHRFYPSQPSHAPEKQPSALSSSHQPALPSPQQQQHHHSPIPNQFSSPSYQLQMPPQTPHHHQQPGMSPPPPLPLMAQQQGLSCTPGFRTFHLVNQAHHLIFDLERNVRRPPRHVHPSYITQLIYPLDQQEGKEDNGHLLAGLLRQERRRAQQTGWGNGGGGGEDSDGEEEEESGTGFKGPRPTNDEWKRFRWRLQKAISSVFAGADEEMIAKILGTAGGVGGKPVGGGAGGRGGRRKGKAVGKTRSKNNAGVGGGGGCWAPRMSKSGRVVFRGPRVQGASLLWMYPGGA